MEYTPKYELVDLPLGRSTTRAALYYLHKSMGTDITKAGPLYVPQAARNGVLAKLQGGDAGEAKQRWAEALFDEYIQRADEFATNLIETTPTSEVTAFVCVPTTRPTFMAPYHSAATRLCNGAIDLTPHLTPLAGWSSRSVIPLDQKVAQLDFHPPENINPGQNVLVVDDVINSGSSVAAVIQRIANYYSEKPLVFTVACALWIDPGS